MTEKRFTPSGRWIKDNYIDKLLNIDFNTITDRNLCCDLLNQIEDEKKRNGKIATKYFKENEQLKKEYYQMRNLYFENAEDICDDCKYRYLVEVKDIPRYYHQKCKKGYSECPKGTVTYCGDFELKGD